MNKNKEVIVQMKLKTLTILFLIGIIFYSFFVYSDWKSFNKCNKAVKLLAVNSPEINYCKAWCSMYG